MDKFKLFVLSLTLVSLSLLTQGQAQNSFITGSITTSGTTTDCSTAGTCIILAVQRNAGGASININGTFSGTLQFEAATDPAGQNYTAIAMTPLAGGTAVTSATAAGSWTTNASGIVGIRVRASALASGSAQVSIQQSTASANSRSSSTGGSSGPANNPSNSSALVDATAPVYGLKNTGRFVWDATIANSTSTITCPQNDCNFKSADVGLKVFGTNATTPGYVAQNTSIVVLPIGTISTVNSAQSITVSTTSTAGAAALCAATGQVGCLLAWGPDETVAINAAFAAATAACGTVLYPGMNVYGTGPSFMFFNAPIMSIAGSGGNSGSIATCSRGTEGARTGIQVRGQSFGTTLFVPTPDFNGALCTYGNSSLACNATVWDGLKLDNIGFFGAGQSVPTGLSTKYFMEINPIAGGNPAAGNVSMKDVSFMNYGSGTTGMLGCLLFNGGVTVVENLNEDGCGQRGIVVPGNTTNSTNITLINVQAVDNWTANLVVNGSTINSGTTVSSYGGVYGFIGQSGGRCQVNIIGGVGQPAVFESFGDFIGYGVTNPNSNQQNGLCVGYSLTGGAVTNSIANLHGSVVDIGGSNPTGSNGAYVSSGAGNVIRAINTRFNATGTGTVTGLAIGGLFVNEGGNTINSMQNFGGTGLIGGIDSLQGSCSGVASAAATLGLYGLGQTAALTCTSTTVNLGLVMDRAKTLMGLSVTATAAGTNASSGVVTVLKNGSATSITCTIGTAVVCSDYSHATTVVQGDVISVQFTTQAADTLAGVHAMLPTAN